MDGEAMRQLSELSWPGNVAQLRRVLAETVTRQRTGVIGVDKLPAECSSLTRRRLTRLEALERDAIVRSLSENDGSKADAADALGMSRATIYRKIKDFVSPETVGGRRDALPLPTARRPARPT